MATTGLEVGPRERADFLGSPESVAGAGVLESGIGPLRAPLARGKRRRPEAPHSRSLQGGLVGPFAPTEAQRSDALNDTADLQHVLVPRPGRLGTCTGAAKRAVKIAQVVPHKAASVGAHANVEGMARAQLGVLNPGRDHAEPPQFAAVLVRKDIVRIVGPRPPKPERPEASCNIGDARDERTIRAVRALRGSCQHAIDDGRIRPALRRRHKALRLNAAQPVLGHIVPHGVQKATANHGRTSGHLRMRGRIEEQLKAAVGRVADDEPGKVAACNNPGHTPLCLQRRGRLLVGTGAQSCARAPEAIMPVGVPGGIRHPTHCVFVVGRRGVRPRHRKAAAQKLEGPNAGIRRPPLRKRHVQTVWVFPQRVVRQKPLRRRRNRDRSQYEDTQQAPRHCPPPRGIRKEQSHH